MKQNIEYYYNFKLRSLEVKNNSYYFMIDDVLYYFVNTTKNEKEIENLKIIEMELFRKNIFCHKIEKNIFNKYLTTIEDNNYILLKVVVPCEEYSILDMMEFNKKTLYDGNYKNYWGMLWQNKVDLLEERINEESFDSIVTLSIDYYIGLCENAIYYVNKINKNIQKTNLDRVVLSRKRVYYPNVSINFLNPLTFNYDLEVRDIAEFIKREFFFGEDAFLDLQTYLKSVKLSSYSYNMLFARLLFPSYYFDEIDKDNKKIDIIIKKQKDYEEFIKKAYNEISLYAIIDKIDWLIE